MSFTDFQPMQQELLELREQLKSLEDRVVQAEGSRDDLQRILNIIESRVNVDEILREHAAWTRERAEWEQEQT